MLTDLQTEKITHYFNAVLDQDNNGLLEVNDFLEIGESQCILWRYKPLSDDYNRIMEQNRRSWIMFEQHFEEQSGAADVHNFLKFFDKILEPGNEDMYHNFIVEIVGDVFDSFDLNKDGVVSINEYVDMFMCYHIRIKYSAKAFMKLDRNGDDSVSKGELLEAVDEFFKSDDPKSAGNWLFGYWGEDD